MNGCYQDIFKLHGEDQALGMALLFISRLAVGRCLCVKMYVCLALPSFLLERRAERLSLFASVFTGAARQAGYAAHARFECALVPSSGAASRNLEGPAFCLANSVMDFGELYR